MRESLRTTIGQFSSAGGQAQARATNCRAVEPAADLAGAERGNLYMLLEVTGSGGGHTALYRTILNAAQTAFYEASGNVSSALNRAVRSAHLVLLRANEVLPDAAWRAGLSLVAVRDGEAFVAQAGPGLVMISHPNTIDQYPAEAGHFSEPLGSPQRSDVEMFPTSVEAGSMILLAQSNWLEYVRPEALAVVAASESVAVASGYLGQLAGEAELSALLVGFAPGEPVAVSELPAPKAAEPIPAPVPISRPVTYEPRPLKPRPELPADVPPVKRWAEPRVEVGELSVDEPVEEVSPGDAPPARRSFFSRFRRGAGLPPPVEAEQIEEREEEVDEGWEPFVPDSPQAKRSPWPLLLALVVIPLIIAGVVLAMFWVRTQAAEKQFVQMLDGARAAITAAQENPDEAASRAQLVGAHDFLEKAQNLRAKDDRLVALQREYREYLNRVDHVSPLYGIMPLWEFNEEDNSLKRAVHGGDSLFVLDIGRQQVDQFKVGQLGDRITPSDPPVVIRRSQQVANLIVSDLLDMTWTEAVGNQHSRLVVLDSAKTLISLDATYGATRLPIAGQEQWRKPELIMGYGGNLYVVDSEVNQVWRYRPSENGYENEPESYFAEGTRVSLAGVNSIAIDGSVWLLFSDGRLLKFFVGEQRPFVLNGLPDPLSRPTDVVVPLEADQLYIADAGNGRIVEFTKEGEFLRQFRPPEGDILFGMRGLYLDETFGVFYIMTDDVIYKADLPQPAAAPAAS